MGGGPLICRIKRDQAFETRVVNQEKGFDKKERDWRGKVGRLSSAVP